MQSMLCGNHNIVSEAMPLIIKSWKNYLQQ